MESTNETAPTNEVKQIVFKLSGQTRNDIMLCLNGYTNVLHSSVLHSEKVEAESVKKLKKDNAKLYQALLDLPLKPVRIQTLDLDAVFRTQIATTLIANDGLVACLDSVSEETKDEMIKRNIDLVKDLNKLPFSVASCPADESSVSNGKWICRTELVK